MKCLIVDDEPAAIRIVVSFLENFSHFKLIGKCKSAFEAINLLKNNEIDLLFLDINMPGLSGIDFLKSLRNPPVVIITTAYREYAVDSYELEVIDYLHKPFSFDRFFKAVQRAEEKLLINKKESLIITKPKIREKDHLFIKADKKHYKINFTDLLFIESMGDYCKFITEGKTYLSYITLKRLLESLPENFLRVHKSFIVQFDKIDLVEGNMVKISGHKIPIGSSYRKGLFNLLDT
ncbi:MAG: response regulator transcription factor [Chlorobi bacterium]|nr:response regulator transcription factor [Chlorobiota bacterium]